MSDIISCCKFPQLFVDQTPKFDEMIMYDIRPTDGWLGNVATGTTPMGTPTEITQDRFRAVYPNVTKQWTRVNVGNCFGTPCDPSTHQIGWGADRLTYYAEQQPWATPLLCYDQDMHITHAMEHIKQLIDDILRPATTTISSMFLRKRHLTWCKPRNLLTANKTMTPFTFVWTAVGDEEIYFDCSVDPNNVFKMAPQMLQRQFEPLMAIGYGGKNPFKETAPFIELVTDIDTCWELDRLGGATGVGGVPSITGNWRFTEFDATNKYWRYGFSGQIGNYLTRVDMQGLRFNFVRDLGAGSAPNRYRYQIVLPYKNSLTSGAGGAPGIGDDYNPDFQKAQFRISQIHHKQGMELLIPEAKPLNPDMPFGHRDFGGKWQFQMHDLGADQSGNVISNAWQNKGRFAAWFKYYIRPKHTEFLQAWFHKAEPQCVPEIATCASDPGYPAQDYSSANEPCPS